MKTSTTNGALVRSGLARRSGAAVAAALVVVALWALPAGAHIHSSPTEVVAGSSSTVTLTVPHGCDGSPTTALRVQMPQGATGVTAGEVAGWTATVDGREVAWTDGSLPDDVEQDFAFTLTVPATLGRLSFPTVQTCQKGETAWIEEEVEGGSEPEHPAPFVTVVASTADPTAAAPTTDDDDDHGMSPGSASSTTAAAGPTVTAASDASDEDDDNSNTVTVVAIVAAAAVAIAAIAGATVARRRRDAGETDEPEDPDVPGAGPASE